MATPPIPRPSTVLKDPRSTHNGKPALRLAELMGVHGTKPTGRTN